MDMYLKLRNSRTRNNNPLVQASTPGCGTAVDYLKGGPPDIPALIAAGTPWSDTHFEGESALFWDDFSSEDSTSLKTALADGHIEWKRWPEEFTTATIFDETNEPHFSDPI